ncbi:MAG: replication protein [bacterium]
MKKIQPTATGNQDASPQTGKGHGHTEISNELLEAIYAYPFTGVQSRVIWFVVRDSYGWKRKETRGYAFPKVAEEINAERTSVFRAFAQLLKIGVLQRGENGGWVLVKNYNAWGNTPELPLSIVAGKQRLLASNGYTLLGSNEKRACKQRRVAGKQRYMEKERERKKDRGAASAAHSSDLPNVTNDTARNRANMGHPDLPPEGAPDFGRLGFKTRDALTATWNESVDRERKRTACRKCHDRPRASDAWPYCRPCTACSVCEAKADGTRKFQTGRDGIICTTCAAKKS